MTRSTKQIFGLFFLGIGALLFLVALVQAVATLLFLNRATETVGTVTDYEQVQNQIAFMEGTGRLFYPVIRFETDRGEEVSFVSPSGRSERVYEVGSRVGVHYAPGNPSDAKLDSFRGTWGKAAIFGVLGAIFALLGIVTPHGFRDSRRVYP